MKEEILSYLREKKEASMDELAQRLGKEKAKDFRNLVQTISEMERKRQLTFSNAGKIQIRKEKQKLTLKGTFHAHKNGFGFVTLNEEEDDLFIGRNDVNYAIDGDRVEVVITKVADRSRGISAEAKIIDVLEHSLKTAVGQLILDEEKPKYAGYIRSKNQKISQPIYIKKPALVLDGTEILKVEIDKYPTKKHDFFVATILDVVGHKDDPGIDVLEVLESMDIVSEFPERVLKEASAIPDMPSKKDFEGRLDLRNEITFTIDGTDAKDLDDAVHIKKLSNGHFELGVHIADVSYYVQEGSELDKEALNRATSVYVTDRVIPMLPERLSNGICSLNPNVDRLTQSAIMEIDQKGRVVKHTVTQTVIKTTFRMTYSDVNDIITGDKEKRAAFKTIVPSIEQMTELHAILETMRFKRGALNFDTKEAKILVNKTGRPVDIILRQRGVAERMIESFMLVANETVAEHFARLNLPFLYRIHEEPKAEKVQKFIDYASTFGVRVYGTADSISQSALQDIMKAVHGQPYEEVLSMMLLRSMQQARYSEHNHGHYGLAAEFYTHFTSPIRRYPDLLVHRMVRDYGCSLKIAEHFEQVIPGIASQSSSRERRAIEAEREVEAMKKAEFMEEFVGEEFDGIVSSVVKFGLFVELSNTVEGLIHVANLPEFFHYNERNLTLQGEKSGVVFRVGQRIRIKLVRSDKATGEIDFEYLPSEYDVIEKKKHSKFKQDRRQQSYRGDGERKSKPSKGIISRDKKSKKSKGKKPFYKEVTKKGSKNGKRRGKGRRSK
ncbi:ribonuclease R [Streptococcus intermedius]|uniref:ribonuclease R n=1 Tax=Streptococcus intermedius TaxID=1338 RepID=UPI000F691F99|nr:ribonuclease R [Streptococcus intermedius]RSJ20183.1 Ribonuclease R [Streptococcus intermedius]